MHESQSPLLSASDKDFWHGYVDFYDRELPRVIEGLIVEFGVFRGQSARWLLEKYATATIIGVDILAQSPEWPDDGRISYRQVDQGSEEQVAGFFEAIVRPELIIEDGSHIPAHQSRCLRHGLARLASGGSYVLEDIHTSHPDHQYFKDEFGSVQGARSAPPQTALSILLALEQRRRLGDRRLDSDVAERLSEGEHFDLGDIRAMDEAIASILFFKRCTLPRQCYSCGSTSFDYHTYRCSCGVELTATADSMTAVIRKRQESQD